ncbi:TPA: phage head closure protein [Escherichia coli]|uniref:phage head closure protein n=1 Tax=Escherichia coli TaxID=562 RepID=UPI0007E3B6B2|nr:phage head closure protein [Escherichia coli]DAM07619.1 MAG TPA: head tail adaptor [Caudoviricetes sp.]EEQ2457791.1 phage head closure protein [Escherichia coli]EFC9864214.1 phage head closure protein [Escherichia coli]EFG2179124.1 phage head closure protein [Escherichia coli]EFJ5688373.1 phage head closure protein [Escherichia coli]
MIAGNMRNRVTIMTFTTQRLPSGAIQQIWTEGETIWAEVKGISGRELLTAGAETAPATIRVWVRYRGDISAASRLKVLTGAFAGSTLNIIGIPLPDAKRTRLEILAKVDTEK